MTPTIQSQNHLTERRRFIGRLLQQTVNKSGPLSVAELSTLKSLNRELSELETDISIESERDYGRAFRRYIFAGDKFISQTDRALFTEREKRDMGSAGGAYPGSTSAPFAPVTFVDEVFLMLKQTDRLFDENVITKIETGRGGPATIPNMDDTTSAATPIAQGTQDIQTEPRALGQLAFATCPTWKSGIIKTSMELDQDSAIPLESLFARSFGIRFARGIGASNVATLLTQATFGAVAVGSAGNTGGSEDGTNSVGTDDLHNLLSSVNEAYLSSPKCFWAMRFTTYQKLMAIKDKSGRSVLTELYSGKPVIEEQYNSVGDPLLLGRPVIYSPSMPPIASGNKCIALGDFSRFIVRTVAGSMRVQRFSERWIDQAQIGFEAYTRADAGLMVTPGSDSPIKYLQNV